MSVPPVLFLIFNRPELTDRVFACIREARPSQLFVAADGPRSEMPCDAELCEQTRRIIGAVDWDCEIVTLFREKNLGCRKAVSSAIDWFFEQVEEGIILEDDCLPSQSFFRFCQELLEYYRHDSRVMQICGSNFLTTNLKESYYFSKYGPVWGWASWRRAWRHYDVTMPQWPAIKQQRVHHDFCFDADEICVREEIFDAVYAEAIDTWDYQWVFARLIQNGVSITPKENLIVNIGFSQDATHTNDLADIRRNLERHELAFPLVHPQYMVKNYAFDRQYFETFLKKSGPRQEEDGDRHDFFSRLMQKLWHRG